MRARRPPLRLAAVLVALAPTGSAVAETLVAATTIRNNTVLTPDHVARADEKVPGGVGDPALVLGQETRIVIYAGQPIRLADIGPPALVDRNQIVPLVFDHGGLLIETEGRALDRAAEGEVIRVINLSSRNTVSGTVDAHGRIRVGDVHP
jgi:flagella basal body P-ring formation protein FlgA